MTLHVLIDQRVANEVMAREGPDGFDRWWDALGVLVRLTWPDDPRHAGKREAAGPTALGEGEAGR